MPLLSPRDLLHGNFRRSRASGAGTDSPVQAPPASRVVLSAGARDPVPAGGAGPAALRVGGGFGPGVGEPVHGGVAHRPLAAKPAMTDRQRGRFGAVRPANHE